MKRTLDMLYDDLVGGPVLEDSACSRCTKRRAAELHPCPFKQDVNDDSDTLCDCCSECSKECAADI